MREKRSAYKGGVLLVQPSFHPESCLYWSTWLARLSVRVPPPIKLTHILHKAAIAMLSDLRTFRQRARALPLLICVKQA